MLEASVRYERLYAAVQRGNYELATAYWEGIKGSLESGIVRRPARSKNAQEYFLAVRWAEIDNAFKSRDPTIARAGFMQARAACMGCHDAEKRAFLNGQPMFDDLVFK